MLLVAVPALGYFGFRTLLDSRTGTFVENPGPADPGWQALVDPSPLTAVVEIDHDDRVTGIAVLAEQGLTLNGGAVILVPAELNVGDRILGSLAPKDAVDQVEAVLKLRIPVIEVVGQDRWAEILQGTTYSLQNPDPVADADGDVVFPVGEVDVGGGRAALFLGRSVPGADSLATLVRRELFWNGLLQNPPPVGTDALSRQFESIASGSHEVSILPFDRGAAGAPAPDTAGIEELVNRLVPFPAGASDGDRLRIDIVDRTGAADLDAVANTLGSRGLEVVSIGNSSSFGSGPTVLWVSPEFGAVEELQVDLPGIAVVSDSALSRRDPIVLRLGDDYQDVLGFPASP